MNRARKHLLIPAKTTLVVILTHFISLQPSLALAIQVLPKYKTENEKNYPADPSDHTNKSYSNNRFPLTSLKETEEDLEYIDIEEGEEQVKSFLKSVFLGGIVFGLFLWCEKDEDPNKQCFKN